MGNGSYPGVDLLGGAVRLEVVISGDGGVYLDKRSGGRCRNVALLPHAEAMALARAIVEAASFRREVPARLAPASVPGAAMAPGGALFTFIDLTALAGAGSDWRA